MKEDFSSQPQIEPRASGDIAFAVLCMFGEHTVIKVLSETLDVFIRSALNVGFPTWRKSTLSESATMAYDAPRPSGGVSQLMLRAMRDRTTRIWTASSVLASLFIPREEQTLFNLPTWTYVQCDHLRRSSVLLRLIAPLIRRSTRCRIQATQDDLATFPQNVAYT